MPIVPIILIAASFTCKCSSLGNKLYGDPIYGRTLPNPLRKLFLYQVSGSRSPSCPIINLSPSSPDPANHNSSSPGIFFPCQRASLLQSHPSISCSFLFFFHSKLQTQTMLICKLHRSSLAILVPHWSLFLHSQSRA